MSRLQLLKVSAQKFYKVASHLSSIEHKERLKRKIVVYVKKKKK